MPLTDPDERHVTIVDEQSTCQKYCTWCRCSRKSFLRWFQAVSILLMAGAGFGVGWVLRSVPPFDNPGDASRQLMYLFYPSELILRALAFISLAVFISSITASLGSLDYFTSAKVVTRTVVYFVVTGLIAIGEAVGISYAIRSGRYIAEGEHNSTNSSTVRVMQHEVSELDTVNFMLDFFRWDS